MQLIPQPGDRWTLEGHPTIEVVAIKSGDVYYSFGHKPVCDPLAKFLELAQRSIDRGAVLRRGSEVFAKSLEDFEV